MGIENVAIIYDDRPRPETTGTYCLRALGQLVKATHILPEDVHQLKSSDFDLFIRIDDGLRYELPAQLRPKAYWAIDTHLDFEWARLQARTVDFTFTAQRDGAERLRAAGINHAHWLPLACDPSIHRRHSCEKEFDLCFIGNLTGGERSRLVKLLKRRYGTMFVGNRYFDEMAIAYSRSRIIFNRSIRNDINMRVFEAMACGSLLVTNDLSDNGQGEQFCDGVHLATYREDGELFDKIDYYLAHSESRERVAAQGHDAVHSAHTYQVRMQSLLEYVDQTLGLAKESRKEGTINARADAANRHVASPIESAMNSAVTASGLTQTPVASQDDYYFDFARPELLNLIPVSARTILEVGCAAGRLGESIKARQYAHVTGIELDANAAQIARTRLDTVVTGSVEDEHLSFARSEFDCVVCGDVIEHLRHPSDVLRRIRAWLQPQGRLIASIPNARHHSVVGSLLNGNWTYERSGLLDATHRHFYTRLAIEQLLYRCGFAIRQMQIVPGPGYSEWESSGRPGKVQAGWLTLSGIHPEDAEEFYVYQYLIDAAPVEVSTHPLTSIVIVTHNGLAYTRACVDSILTRTDESYELVFVDNGSTDGTVEYLHTLPGGTVIANSTNLGFPAAVNQGIAVSRGDQVLLLNNDVVVTVGWLRRMLDAMFADPRIGIVGPITNWPECPQSVPVPYGDDLLDVESFSFRRMKQFDGQRSDTGEVVGFCMLLRRELIDQLGPFDERYGLGQCEDKDYCARATRAGFRIAIAQDSFVHHFGHRTFLAAGIDSTKLLQQNLKRFRSLYNGKDQHSSRELAQKPLLTEGRQLPDHSIVNRKQATSPSNRLIRLV